MKKADSKTSSKLMHACVLAALLLVGCGESIAVEQTAAWEFSTDAFVADATADAEAVYFGTSDGSFYALQSKTGAVLWNQPLGLGVYSRPALHEDSVLVAGSTGVPFNPESYGPAEVVSLQGSDGAIAWRTAMDGSFQPQVYPYEDRIVATVGPRVYCLDVQTGAVRWEYKHRTGMVMGVAQNDGLIIVQGADGRLKAFDAAGGGELWTASARAKVFFRPIIANDLLFTGNLAGELIAIHAKSGEEAWSIKTGGGLEGRCVIADDALLFTNRNAEVYAVDVRTGAERWKKTYKVAGKNSSQFAGVDAAAGRFAFSALEKGLFVLDAQSGEELRRISTNASMSFVTLSGDIALFSPLRAGGLTAVSLVP